MKRYLPLLALLFLFLHPSPTKAMGLSGPGCANGNGGGGATISCTASNAAGRAQIVAVKWCDGATTACTTNTSSDTFAITDTQGNSYGQCKRLDSASSTDRRAMAVCLAQNLTATGSNTVQLAVTSGNTVQLAGIMVSEVGGVTATVTLDQFNTLDAAASNSPISISTPSATAAPNELVYAWMNIETDAATLTIGTGYSSNRSVDTNEKDEWTSAPTTGIKTATMTYSGSHQQRAIIVTYATSPLPVGTYFLSPTGNDTNTGVDSSHPWFTPNHPMTCGSVILAASSTAYTSAELTEGNWGAVSCPGNPDVAWLKCVTFDTCKMTASGGNPGLYVDQSYWGVQGFEVSVTADTFAGCFFFVPNSGTKLPVHHGVFANNVASGCFAGGIGTGNSGTGSGDYFAAIGNIAYNGAAGSFCYSNINVYQPLDFDQKPDTHIYIGGNYSFKALNTPNCNGGFPASDGEGINIDTPDGDQSGIGPYTQRIVVDNNIVVGNGGRGIEVENNTICTTCSHVYVRQNTLYGNSTDNTQTGNPCSELQISTAFNVEVYLNISVPNVALSCNGQTVYAYQVSTSPSATVHAYKDWGYSSFGNNGNASGSSGFSFGPNNTFGTNPNLANPSVPGAPNCSGFSSVPACMATLIANVTPTNPSARAYGYQPVSVTQTVDPLFPQWLCGVTNLPAGLVTMGCAKATNLSGGSISGATIH